MVIVSACLVGLNTRYDGTNASRDTIVAMLRNGEAIPLCPEQLGGLPTPRPPSTLIDGDGLQLLKGNAHVMNEHHQDVTNNFLQGAREVAKIVQLLNIKEAYLKEGSPSCGVNYTNVGWTRHPGIGVTAALLKQLGVKVHGVE